MVFLFRSNNLFSSRVNKYVNYYITRDIPYHVFGWDRKGDFAPKENYSYYNYRCGIGVGGLKAIRNHIRWMHYVYRSLVTSPEVTTIHACDLNSAFPAAVYKCVHNRNVKLIFDVCDWFSANFHNNPIICSLLSRLEKFTCDKADDIIICEPERREQIGFPLKKDPLVLPNIPDISLERVSEIDSDPFLFDNNNITVSYFGGLNQDRFLVELFELAETEQFNLLVAGFGDELIEKVIEKVAKKENVRFFGKRDMQFGLAMSKHSDISYAMYCKTNPNHIYAAPNKFYEALFLGKPIISTKGTIVEKKIQKYKIGYTIDESIEELRSLICSLDRSELLQMGQNARNAWDTYFKNYVRDFFDNEYIVK